MKNKLFIKGLSISLLVGGVFATSATLIPSFAIKTNNIQNDIIKPLSHIRGEVINTLPLDIQEWYKRSADKYENIWTLYNAHPDMDSRNWTLTPSKSWDYKYFSETNTKMQGTYSNNVFYVPAVVSKTGKYATKTPINLIVDGNYKTTYQENDNFDPTGLTFKIVYSNNTATVVPLSDITWSNNTLEANQTAVTASYNGVYLDIPVLVTNVAPESNKYVGVTFSGIYKDYYAYGEELNKNSLIITAHFADGSSKVVTDQVVWKAEEFDTKHEQCIQSQTALYEKWDDFKQINNVLKWEVKEGVEVENYNVIVSLNPELTQVLYKASVTEPEYKMLNMYTGEDYYWQVTVNKTGGESIKSPIYHFVVEDTPRTLNIPGISNTRDVGGYDTPWGEFKQGYIYRGARIEEATATGIDVFKNELGINTDLDLRTPGEGGSYNPQHVKNYVGPVDLLSYQMLDPAIVPYNDDNPTGRKEVLRRLKYAMETFADPNNYPVYFHCSVGRDRTGTIGAVLDGLMGRSADEIVHNYFISVFSVTGHYAYKDIVNGFNNAWSLITAFNNVPGGEGKTIAEQVELLLLEAGMTQNQIDSIRNIVTGKDDRASNSRKFLTNDDNYEGQVVVSFKQVGDEQAQVFAPTGTVITSPITLKDGYGWYNGEELVNLAKPVNKSMNLVSKLLDTCKVKIHYMKGNKEDEVLTVNKGEVILIEDFAINGLVPTAYLDNGSEISKYTVTRDATINLLYQ